MRKHERSAGDSKTALRVAPWCEQEKYRFLENFYIFYFTKYLQYDKLNVRIK